MEFFVVVIIFVACMIALALLIYYCQEHRNPKYNFTDNQRDISAIALAIGVPSFDGYQSHLPPPGLVNRTQPAAPPVAVSLPLKEYPISDEELSDSGSSSSSKIYFNPNTTAYSVAKRMSMAANVEALAKRMSCSSYLMSKRMSQQARASRDEVAEVHERPKESAPPPRTENICYPKQNQGFPKKIISGVGSKRTDDFSAKGFAEKSSDAPEPPALAPLDTVAEE